MFDFALAEKVIRSIISDQGKPVGGHGYGHTPVGKHNTEFPKSWGDDEIAAAFYETLEYGMRSTKGSSVLVSCLVDGVECRLEFNLMMRPVEKSVMFRPLKGLGVVDVTWVKGRRKEKLVK